MNLCQPKYRQVTFFGGKNHTFVTILSHCSESFRNVTLKRNFYFPLPQLPTDIPFRNQTWVKLPIHSSTCTENLLKFCVCFFIYWGVLEKTHKIKVHYLLSFLVKKGGKNLSQKMLTKSTFFW
jgi:hypothetical protein